MKRGIYFHDIIGTPYILSRDGIFVDAKDSFLKLTGYENKDIQQKTENDVFKNLLRINVNFKELSSHQGIHCYFINSSYEIMEANISINTYKESNEKYYVFSGLCKFTLKGNIGFLDQLFNENHYGLAIYSSKDFILLKYNEKYGNYLGKPFDKKESCIGLKLDQIIPDFSGSEWQKIWWNIANTRESIYLEECNIGIGPMKGRYWENTISPVAVDGTVKYIVSMLNDVTDKVEAKKQLEEQAKIITKNNKQLETIIEGIDDYLSIIDSNGNYIKLNKFQKERYDCDTNLSVHNFIDKNYQYYEWDGREISYDDLTEFRVLKGEKVIKRKVAMIRNDKRFYYEVSGIPIMDEDGSFLMGVLIHHDITELIEKTILVEYQKEELLKFEREKNEVLQQSMEMKDEFISLVSHELRTPLNVINTAIQAMDYLYRDELPDKAKGYIKTIRQNIFRQLRLVNNLLDITRANSGRVKINKKNIDIVFITKAIVESVYSYASQKGIKITFVTKFDKKIIGMDDEKYERILLNLLSNAIKFTPEGKNIVVNLSNKKGSICVVVKDSGIGIPEEKQNIIFDRFGQVDSSLSRRAEGAGIGLSLAKRFVEALGGTITVKSRIGRGSTFTILLPNNKVKEENTESHMINLMDNRLVQLTKVEFSDIYL